MADFPHLVGLTQKKLMVCSFCYNTRYYINLATTVHRISTGAKVTKIKSHPSSSKKSQIKFISRMKEGESQLQCKDNEHEDQHLEMLSED